MSLKSLLDFIRPAHKVPHTVWSSDTPLTLKPRFVTLLFLISGLWIFGTGEAILIDAGIGVSPWTVVDLLTLGQYLAPGPGFHPLLE